jgi:hypothetical protein
MGIRGIVQIHILSEPDHVLRFQDGSDVTLINMHLVSLCSNFREQIHKKQVWYQTPALQENKLNIFI